MNASLFRRLAPASAAAALAALLLSAPAGAQPAPISALSLEEAVQLAGEGNPAFLQQQNDMAVSRSAVRSAYGGLLPRASVNSTLGYTASGQRRFGDLNLGGQPEMYTSNYVLGLSYQLSGTELLRPRVERSRLRATQRQVDGAAAELRAQVVQQYLTVLQAREQVAQAERERERTGEHLRLAQARLEVGSGTPLEVRSAEVNHGRSEVGLVRAQNSAATAVLVLSQLIGTELAPDVQLTSEFTVFEPRWEEAELVELAIGNNPDLLAARASQSAAGTAVSAARSSYLPSLSMSVGLRGHAARAGDQNALINRMLGQIADDYSSCTDQNEIRSRVGMQPTACANPADPTVIDMVRQRVAAQNAGYPFDYEREPLGASLTISLPIFTGLSRQLEVDRAKAAAADARYQVRAEELRLRQEVGTALRNLETAHRTVELQEQIRANAEEELRLAQERFRFGAASSVEVTDAQTNLRLAEKDLIDAVYDFHKSLATLETLVGRPLREP